MEKVFAAIDLKSFYASVECHERGLDPLTTNLVVADASRTDKTICLAISPSLKSYGLPGRARLFEVNQKVREINALRRAHTTFGTFLGKSSDQTALLQNPNLELDFIIAPPRMQYYLDYSSQIYNLYLQHLAPDDLFAYSIDEIFCDLTSYLKMSRLTPEEFVTQMILDVYHATGITATAGIGTNLFLAKVAMDILAKHAQPNRDGVRIAQLDELSFREQLWPHQPITDFWRVGHGSAQRLAKYNLHTMGDVARCSLANPNLLYRLFGINAELLIDHSWGYECVNIADIKQHQPATRSLSSGQVLAYPYNFQSACVILKEMAENLSLELVRQHSLARQVSLCVEYDPTSLAQTPSQTSTHPLKTNRYGKLAPQPTLCSLTLPFPTSSTKLIRQAFLELYHTKVAPQFLIRKITVAAQNLAFSDQPLLPPSVSSLQQADLFTNYTALAEQATTNAESLQKEHRAQTAILKIRSRYGKNSILHGTNFEAGATGRLRHRQIGGHRA